MSAAAKIVVLFVLGVFLIIAYLDRPSLLHYAVYSILIVFLLLYVSLQARSFFLSVLSILFFLGNWLKVSIHGIFDYPYIEPNGGFEGTHGDWARFYEYSIVIAMGLVSSKFLFDLLPRSGGHSGRISGLRVGSNIYTLFSIILIITIYALNWRFGFYRIGVARDLDLPLGLNAPASFMVFLGAPILLSILATNSVVKAGMVPSSTALAVAITTVAASVTTYSRATVIIVMLPILYGLYFRAEMINGKRQSLKPLIYVLGPALAASVALVSLVRSYVYSSGGSVDADRLNLYLLESVGLFFDRWIGAEGLMTALKSPQSTDLLLRMLYENPAAGVGGIYQKLSDSHYVELSGMTFLTLPGAFGILAFSGSLAILFIGVVGISFVGISIEEFVRQAFRDYPSLRFLIATNLAYHFTQMVFPVLLIPFLVQLIFFLLAAKLFVRLGTRLVV